MDRLSFKKNDLIMYGEGEADKEYIIKWIRNKKLSKDDVKLVQDNEGKYKLFAKHFLELEF